MCYPDICHDKHRSEHTDLFTDLNFRVPKNLDCRYSPHRADVESGAQHAAQGHTAHSGKDGCLMTKAEQSPSWDVMTQAKHVVFALNQTAGHPEHFSRG